MTAVNIEEKLRRSLKADKRPHREIAKKADIHFVNLSKFLHGRTMKLDALCRLADVLGMEITIRDKR